MSSKIARHSAADGTADAALAGWVGRSRSALEAAAADWAQATTALSTRVYRHGEALRVCGLTFAAMEAEHAGRLSAVGRR